jgi:Zn-finger nucleic acid-binding protein
MDCPVCKVPLIVVERHRIEIDYCISCRGIWFDKGEINLLSGTLKINKLEDIIFNLSNKSFEKVRQCPRCDKKMDKVSIGNNSTVLLDKCPDDEGMWFDSGEMSKATNYASTPIDRDKAELINFVGEIIKTRANPD